jgi:dihydroorotase
MQGCAAGIYTSPILLPLVAELLESFGAIDKLEGFVSTFGRRFYGMEGVAGSEFVELRKVGEVEVPESYSFEGECVVPFWAGKRLSWEIIRRG